MSLNLFFKCAIKAVAIHLFVLQKFVVGNALPKEQVQRQLEAGQNVVFDVDVKGGCNIKRFYGDKALSIFIQPPSVEALRKRLEGRATDAPEVINDRIARAEYELSFASQFDRVIVNDDLETAKSETLEAITAFLSRS